MKNRNLLHITNELNTVDGVTSYLFTLLSSLPDFYDGEIFVIAGGGNNTNIFADTKIQTVINPVLNHKVRSMKNFASSVKYILKYVIEHNIGIIHTHNHYAANIARYVSKLTGVKTIQTNHGFFPDTGRLKLFNAGCHVVLSKKALEHLKEKGIPEERIKLIKPGIAAKYSAHEKNINTFLAASRFSAEKGMDKYIIAANAAAAAYPGKYKFYISGKGEEESALKMLNKEKGGAVGFVSDYGKCLSESAVFVFTTEADEGLPIVLLEAVFSGCLIVSADYKGVSALFPRPFDRLLFKPGDAKGLEEKMIYAADNCEKLSAVYSNHYDVLKKEYSLEKMRDEHLLLYKNILK